MNRFSYCVEQALACHLFAVALICGGAANLCAATDANIALSSTSMETVTADPAVQRTADDIMHDPHVGPSIPLAPGTIINRPTIGLDRYKALKATLSSRATAKEPQALTVDTFATNAPVEDLSFDAATEVGSGNFYPSDSDLAVGPNQVVELTNSSLDIFQKVSSGSPGPELRSISENRLVSSPDSLGDGRVLYDRSAGRWVVSIDDFSNLAGAKTPTPNLYLAVSATSDATGSWSVYKIKLNTKATRFVDFPQLGMDQNALLFTANLFGGTGDHFTPGIFSIPKSKAYGGGSINVRLLTGRAVGSVAPPIVVGSNPSGVDYFLASRMGAKRTSIMMYKMINAGTASASLSRPIMVNVGTYNTPPPLAAQTCSAGKPVNQLDTLDGRFQNASVQNGTMLWNAHTIVNSGDPKRPIVRWYEINLTTGTVVQSGEISFSNTSNDFNPSIASAVQDEAVLNWSVTDPSNGEDAMMVFGGRSAGDPLGTMTANATPLAMSPTCMTGDFDSNFGFQRWGDYSAVSLDFADGSPNSIYWLVNQITAINPPRNFWGTRIGRVSSP